MTTLLESDAHNMMIREENLRTTMVSRIVALIIGGALVALGLAIKIGIVDISMIKEAWEDHALSVFTVWWSYAGVGIMLLIAACIPSKYKSAKLYTDKIELTKKETKTYDFANIFDVSIDKHAVRITFKDGSPQIHFVCHKKSAFPRETGNQFLKWQRETNNGSQ